MTDMESVKIRTLYKARKAKAENDKKSQISLKDKAMILGKIQLDSVDHQKRHVIHKGVELRQSFRKIVQEPKRQDHKSRDKDILNLARKKIESQKAEFEAYKQKKLYEIKIINDEPRSLLGATRTIPRQLDSRASSPSLTDTTRRFCSSASSPKLASKQPPLTPAFFEASHSPAKRYQMLASPSKPVMPFSAVYRSSHTLRSSATNLAKTIDKTTQAMARKALYGGGVHYSSNLMVTRKYSKDKERISPMDEANLSAIVAKDPRNHHDSEADRSLLTEYRLMNDIKAVSDMTEHTPVRRYATHND